MCVRCGGELTGRQQKYCSIKCKSNDAVTRHRRERKIKAVEYMGNSCYDCGYNRSYDALQFHHPDDNKDFGISGSGMTRSWEKTKAELEKCVMLCANCHAERHSYIPV